MSGSAPYSEPQIGGKYGGYIGMTGNWATWQHCGDKVAWSDTNAADADTNFSTYHVGIGTGVYWFMGGPGVDPHYNGTTAEAYAWGQQQAIRTLSDVAKLTVTYPVIFADVEIPGNAPGISPAPDNGWNSVYTSPCSGKVSQSGISAAVDRADFDGFFDEIAHNSTFTPGVYSSAPVWTSIFGTGSSSQIKHTYEDLFDPAAEGNRIAIHSAVDKNAAAERNDVAGDVTADVYVAQETLDVTRGFAGFDHDAFQGLQAIVVRRDWV